VEAIRAGERQGAMTPRTGKATVQWYGPAVTRQLRRDLIRGLRLATAWTRKRIVKRISKSSRVGGGARSPTKGGRKPMRFQHSRPGEPPRSDTGKLRQSIYGQVSVTALRGEVGTTLKYGAALEKGVRGGTFIRPKQKKVLVFGVGGRWRFSKGHAQGAIKPRPYIWSTVTQNRRKLMALIVRPARARMGAGFRMGMIR